MKYDAFMWLPVAGGLSALLLVAAFFAFRKRGASAGLRLVGWAALPMAIWLTDLSRLIYTVVVEATRWIGGVFLSPKVWIGVALFALWFFLLGGVGIVRRRRKAKGGETTPSKEVATPTAAGQPAAAKKAPAAIEKGTSKPKAKNDDDPLSGFEDIDEILKRRGIS
ncbi:hypothetical protein [Tenggerimyces flavus]|uniref:Cellulose synthase n=1 Tax=Tenggerimyces flavus TaxID=1708749 RepID=A0ABV7YEQ5_9ACTN|nr:hypothetical protein [Tenggerimyces flavus]MBM7787019.1 hypothetical protein [Tenggerimyces flavus]